MRALVTVLAVALAAILLAGLAAWSWFTPRTPEGAGAPESQRSAPPAAHDLPELAPAEPLPGPAVPGTEPPAEGPADARQALADPVLPEPEGLEDGGQGPPIAPPGDPAQGQEWVSLDAERTRLQPKLAEVDLGSGKPASTLTPEQVEALKRGEKPRR